MSARGRPIGAQLHGYYYRRSRLLPQGIKAQTAAPPSAEAARRVGDDPPGTARIDTMCRIEHSDGQSEVWVPTDRKARKDHRCTECGRAIKAGEMYQHVFSVTNGDAGVEKTCRHCRVGQEWLLKNCGGYIYGEVSEELAEHAEEYPQIALPLLRFVVGRDRKWKRFGSDDLMPLPRPAPSIK